MYTLKFTLLVKDINTNENGHINKVIKAHM